MSDYMPTTEEIRDAVAHGMATPRDQLRSATWWRLAFNRWHAAELRKAKAEALREAADDLDHCTDADVNNAIGRPRPSFSHTERFADVLWLHHRADQIEEDE